MNKKTHILFIGVFNNKSTNVSQATAFNKLGFNIIEYNYREMAAKFGELFRDNDIIQTCENKNPFLTIFSKCNQVHYRVIEECNKYSKTCLWFMDFISMSWDKELEEKIKRCTFSCFGIRKSFELAKSLFDNCYFIHEGFDEFINFPVQTNYKYDVTFIGNMRDERMPFFNHKKFNIINNAYGQEHNKVVAQSKINLNFTTGEGTSDRTYKILASKGFLLTQPWQEMELDFEPRKDFDIFSTPEEMNDKIKHYLKNEQERKLIAEYGYKTVQQYTRTNWAKEILWLYERHK